MVHDASKILLYVTLMLSVYVLLDVSPTHNKMYLYFPPRLDTVGLGRVA